MKIVCLLFALLAHMVTLNEAAEIWDFNRLFALSNKTEEMKYLCADIVFAIDTSCSVKNTDKRKMVEIVAEIVKGVNVTQNTARFGIVLFDHGARKQFGVSKNIDNTAIINLLEDLKTNIKDEKEGCKTFTWEALELVRNDTDLLGSVSRYDNTTGKERKRILILLTDGVPYETNKNKPEMAIKTKEMGRLNDLANITTFVVHVPKNGELEPIPLLKDLVSELRWKFEVHTKDKQAILEEVAEFLILQLVRIGSCDYRCIGKIDLCLVMDRSDSIEVKNLKLMKEFFKDLADSFLITYEESKFTSNMIGVSSYNSDVYQHSLGTRCKDNTCVRAAIDSIPENVQTFTETDDALENVGSQCLAKYVTRGHGIPRVAIIATDGNTWEEGTQHINSPPTIKRANHLRSMGIDTEVIGVPNYQDVVGIDEWNKTASHFVFDMRNNTGPGWSVHFEDLKAITGTVARKICEHYTAEQSNEV